MPVKDESARSPGEIFLVAGEASGDHHAADLARSMLRQEPALRLSGMGGRELAAAGQEQLHDSRDLAVMGLAEVVGSLARARRVLAGLVRELERRRPRAVVLVDFPDFNLRLARAAHRLGLRVVYFISPQVWAWRPGRVRALSRDVDQVLCILPFEVPFFRRHGARATYVGHPLVDQVPTPPDRAAARRRLGLPAGERVLALLPGSRRQEARALLPAMIEAARRLGGRSEIARVILPVASSLAPSDMASAAGGPQALAGIRLVEGMFFDAVAAADVALVASGTATLATAMVGTPMVLGYRLHPLTFVPVSYLARVPHVGLVNLVADRRVVPELIQDDFTGENLTRLARRLLHEPAAADGQRRAFIEVRARLGRPGVFERAAAAVLQGPGDSPQNPLPV
jgi:lipid-A-disaccharide synthase